MESESLESRRRAAYIAYLELVDETTGNTGQSTLDIQASDYAFVLAAKTAKLKKEIEVYEEINARQELPTPFGGKRLIFLPTRNHAYSPLLGNYEEGVYLTRTEGIFLSMMMKHPDWVFTPSMFVDELDRMGTDLFPSGDMNVRKHISNLRGKLGDVNISTGRGPNAKFRLIHNVGFRGYTMTPNASRYMPR